MSDERKNFDHQIVYTALKAHFTGDEKTFKLYEDFLKDPKSSMPAENRHALLEQIQNGIKNGSKKDFESASAQTREEKKRDSYKNTHHEKLVELYGAWMSLFVRTKIQDNLKIAISTQLEKPPRKTWWEWITGSNTSYQNRFLEWTLNPSRMKIEYNLLVSQDKKTVFEFWNNLAGSLHDQGWNRAEVLMHLHDIIAQGSAFFKDQKNQADLITRMFVLAYLNAVRANPVLIAAMGHNRLGGRDLDRIQDSPVVMKGSKVFVNNLYEHYTKTLNLWLNEFSRVYKS